MRSITEHVKSAFKDWKVSCICYTPRAYCSYVIAAGIRRRDHVFRIELRDGWNHWLLANYNQDFWIQSVGFVFV